ncbi:putative F-box protein At4g38870 [Lycium ferocissimum]|uniref:putative F-box protein At4g38870 n=1 Tax=Lycium ferocissimum TaxID=112874 RepID=UPI0028153201|nr:putative F-box protein At4g38870 [Lycium ferocissimum]
MTICSNHCNGLVCLYSYKDAQVYLYNVTTRKIKALPPSVNLEIKIKRYKHPFNPKLLLGFDQVTGNYKLLLLFPHQGAKEAKILTLGVTNSSWRKIDLLNYTDNSYLFSKECIFLNGVIYLIWFTYVAYFNFGEEKFGYISPPPQASFKRPSIMQTAFWGKLAMYCHYIAGPGGLGLFGYDDANKILIPLEMTRPMFIDVAVALLGAERINDKTKEAHVLATTSVISAPASLLSSSSRPCCITFVSSFVEHNNNNTRPRIVLRFASSFVENIISLKSLLV